MHRPWRRGPGGNNGNNRNDSGIREQGFKKTLNLEVLANQKRQWYRIKSKSRVLPIKMMDFLDAAVLFIGGEELDPGRGHPQTVPQLQPGNVRYTVHINFSAAVPHPKVKTCSLAQLPQYTELVSSLGPIHAQLSCKDSISERHHVYRCSEVQAEAAGQFLGVITAYLESLCSNFQSHIITNVQSNNDKVLLLLKYSFIESFPIRDRPFIKKILTAYLLHFEAKTSILL